jgi:hypothetical protein
MALLRSPSIILLKNLEVETISSANREKLAACSIEQARPRRAPPFARYMYSSRRSSGVTVAAPEFIRGRSASALRNNATQRHALSRLLRPDGLYREALGIRPPAFRAASPTPILRQSPGSHDHPATTPKTQSAPPIQPSPAQLPLYRWFILNQVKGDPAVAFVPLASRRLLRPPSRHNRKKQSARSVQTKPGTASVPTGSDHAPTPPKYYKFRQSLYPRYY